MTDAPPPPPIREASNWPQPATGDQIPPPTKNHRKRNIILAAVGVFLLLGIIGSLTKPDTKDASPSPSSTPLEVDDTSSPEPSAENSIEVVTPEPTATPTPEPTPEAVSESLAKYNEFLDHVAPFAQDMSADLTAITENPNQDDVRALRDKLDEEAKWAAAHEPAECYAEVHANYILGIGAYKQALDAILDFDFETATSFMTMGTEFISASRQGLDDAGTSCLVAG